MKRVIRRGVFETNSSSVHSLTMCSDEEWKAWERGKLVFDYIGDELIPLDNENMKPFYHTFKEMIESYWFRDGLRTFHKDYKTEDGEVVHAFGYYGYE